jgi:hypothetical protein
MFDTYDANISSAKYILQRPNPELIFTVILDIE